MIKATDADRAQIEAFLGKNVATMMFPWSNLIRFGMGGDHDRAMTFWMAGEDEVTDLCAITGGGMVMPYCPNLPEEAAAVLRGRPVSGLLGETSSIEGIRSALGLGPAQLDSKEPHFDLDLSDLFMPETGGLSLHPLDHAPKDLVTAWRAAFSVESLSVAPEVATKKAVADIDGYLKVDSHRVLYDGDTPVAMTGFNATVPGVVQIGGVYTPPPMRRRGYARKAVALHLTEARDQGVSRSILCAANEPAARAYRAIGFRQIGEFSVVVYDTPQHV